jgi:hypothetical protein
LPHIAVRLRSYPLILFIDQAARPKPRRLFF